MNGIRKPYVYKSADGETWMVALPREPGRKWLNWFPDFASAFAFAERWAVRQSSEVPC